MPRPTTPGKLPGYAYNQVTDCNWRKCWARYDQADTDPFIIQLADFSLWIAPHHQPANTWGYLENRPPVNPRALGFLGPFDSFDVAWATFQLMVTE